jgi:predicted RND superfamily exporter protein
MLAKRILLVIISLAFGVLATFGIVLLIGTTPQVYGAIYFSFTALALAIALGIWLDKFMGTEILPE